MEQIALVLKVLGWVFTAVPLIAFVLISFWIIRGAMGDDETVHGLVILSITVFLIGVLLLALTYLTKLFI